MARVYNQNVSGRVKVTPGTELWPVSFSKTPTKRGSNFPETFIVFMAHASFLDVSQYFHAGDIVRASICLQGAKYSSSTWQRIRACKQLQKFCEHEKASIRLIFASNSNRGQILRALSN